MAVAPAREQALPLLAAANNHGDLAVKISSLKQAKDILLSVEPSHAADLYPFLLELQFSPETLVRKYLIEVIDEIGEKTMEHLSVFLPVLLTFLKDNNPKVSKQSIITGTKFFYRSMEELAFQFQRHGIVERWLEELWTWMIKFKDTVLDIIFEVGTVGPKLLAIKFMEKYVLHFTFDSNDPGNIPEVMSRPGSEFNISWIIDGHTIVDPSVFVKDASRYLGILLDMLRSASNFLGSLTISVINSLAAIARKRPVYYNSILTTLLELDVNREMGKGRHTVSIQFSLRTAYLGFLRCTHPVIVESREMLLKALRGMNAGEAADQVLRQMDKLMKNNERASRDLRLNKDDQLPNQSHGAGDVTKKRLAPMENNDQNNCVDVSSKRIRYDPRNSTAAANAIINDAGKDPVNGMPPKPAVIDDNLSPVEQMVAMISALIAEGERGVNSLEILISNIHPDLLSDIVIMNMKHLPKTPPPLSSQSSNDTSSDPSQISPSNGLVTSLPTLGPSEGPACLSSTISLPFSDMPTSSNLCTDSKRDPRRDPRRLDPRRVMVPVDVTPLSHVEDNVNSFHHHVAQSDLDVPSSSCPPSVIPQSSSESISIAVVPKVETISNPSETPAVSEANLSVLKDEVTGMEAKEFTMKEEIINASHLLPSSTSEVDDTLRGASLDFAPPDGIYSPSSQDTDQLLPHISNVETSEIASTLLPVFPQYIELAEEQQREVKKVALERIINLYPSLERMDSKHTQMALVARLFAQTDVHDVIGMVQKHIVSDYERQKGHELVMHILYHLHSLVISDPGSSAAIVYEKFLLGLAKYLIANLPASDKSFSRLLGEVPSIPDSVLRLLEDLCTESHSEVNGHDGDHVTQGLGAVWSLILVRQPYRQACLDIALKCAVHSKDDVRAKAIRLVANKLYAISYISGNIEQFATKMFLASVDERADMRISKSAAVPENQMGEQVESQNTSISGSQVSESGSSQNDTIKGSKDQFPNDSSISFSQAQSHVSLFFALCSKKPSLLQLVFDNYAQSPKAVKQAVHRHVPILLRAFESPYSELLHIISNPPRGSEDLLTQVIHILSEGKTPSPDLVAIVKHLYETTLKDATILIPMLSAFSRDEVLPIFPRLVHLPMDAFQTALAHILQITDACSACFEQRTVFTQQVLSNALNQMVDRTPLPLLFMRTVIQAIDAFPTLVYAVLSILMKSVVVDDARFFESLSTGYFTRFSQVTSVLDKYVSACFLTLIL
ncbi:symplekin-like [Dorcoceras hygrometricum]|uniref:Symplekin-like n=1 Tax=Dorcoceras hygrometricum TaxID=472368 RepID=A0A2Z7CP42_9LAMI|nr:symplekin-like [Dorcoceras hygrometricum]